MPGGLPIKLPALTRSIAEFPRFVQETREAIAALRDRASLGSGKEVVIGNEAHPFKVTSNGDDTITIAEGALLWLNPDTTGSVPNDPFVGEYTDYGGETLTVTSTGTLYIVSSYGAEATATDTPFLIASYHVGFDSQSPWAEIDPSLSSGQISLPIATIDLTDGVASVTKQILHHNPLIDIGWAEGITP